MKELRKAIETYGEALGTNVVKVDMFLNHRLDTALMFRMGSEIASHFASQKPDLVLTVESSGIALALTAAHALGNLPVVFAKKEPTVVQTDHIISAPVYSFTHKKNNFIRVDRRYLPEGSRVLIVDDFLADGQAAQGMISLCKQALCEPVGIGVAIEKGFQKGGQILREMGVNLLSLAIVDHIEDGRIILKDD